MVMLLGRVSVAVKAPTPEIAMKETRNVARRREILVDTLVLVLLVLNISGTQQEIEIKSDMATIIKNYDPSIHHRAEQVGSPSTKYHKHH